MNNIERAKEIMEKYKDIPKFAQHILIMQTNDMLQDFLNLINNNLFLADMVKDFVVMRDFSMELINDSIISLKKGNTDNMVYDKYLSLFTKKEYNNDGIKNLVDLLKGNLNVILNHKHKNFLSEIYQNTIEDYIGFLKDTKDLNEYSNRIENKNNELIKELRESDFKDSDMFL